MLIDDPSDAQNFTWQDNVTPGKGESYGLEILIHKKAGKTNGWIGYTLSWTQLQFDEINFGKKFWARYDRRHDISVVIIHELSDNISLSGAWVYGTGNAVTLPVGQFSAMPNIPLSHPSDPRNIYWWYIVDDLGSMNSFRMKPYHRLDLAIQIHKKMKRHERIWEFGLYNAYNRKNPFFYYIENEYNNYDLQTTKLKQVAIFPVVPSISYSFKF
ncbi:MAG: hypothetical protein H3C41_11350 [Bacteroidales bacterium]|nr:hypothetical protein [Bacteroidales bacterium]